MSMEVQHSLKDGLVANVVLDGLRVLASSKDSSQQDDHSQHALLCRAMQEAKQVTKQERGHCEEQAAAFRLAVANSLLEGNPSDGCKQGPNGPDCLSMRADVF